MAIDVQTQVVVRRLRADVAGFMFDPSNDAVWTTGVIECRPLMPGRLRAGSQVERGTRFLGRQFSYRYEVVAADDGRFVEMRVDEPFPMQIRYDLKDAADGTLVRIRARGEAGGFFRMAAPLLSLMVRRNIAHDLQELRKHLEIKGAT